MLTRRGLAGLAGCAICEITGFFATEVSAQTAPPATTPGLTRKLLSQSEGPTPGWLTITMQVEVEPGALIGRHTHPGIEAGYVVDGELELPIEGQPNRALKTGDAFQVPAGTPHGGAKNGAKKAVIVSTYVVEKGKPLASPA